MNFAEFHFIRPYCLFAFIPALTLLFLLLKNKLNRGSWSSICDPGLLPYVLQDRNIKHSQFSISVGSITSCLIIIALAGPTWERLPLPVFRNDAALVIALDLSRSMDAADISPSRLSRARYKITDILTLRKDGQTALLVYAGDAFTVTPLTSDNETIINQLSALNTEIMPSQGSDTVLAIEKAIELLKQTGLQKGDILLVTDEVDFDNTIDILDSLNNYRLSVLGVGTRQGAPIKNSSGGFVKDHANNIVIPKLNTQQLSELANEGNGLYIQITDNDTDIDTLQQYFNKNLEQANNEAQENNDLLLEQWQEKGPWLLLLALPLAALSFRRGLLSLTFLFLMPLPEISYAMEWNDLWETQNQQAQQAFKENKFSQAAEQYNDPQWKAAAHYKAGQFEQTIETLKDNQSAGGLYNKGNALAQTGQLTEAIEAYQDSLKMDPDNEDAKYNKEQVEKALEKQEQQQQQKEQQKSESDNSEQKDSEQNEQQQQSDDSEQSEQQDNPGEDAEKQEEKDQPEQQPEDETSPSDQSQEDEENQPEPADAEEMPKPSDYDESEQASEQWLKRIPDDPAGLLKRKFEYQYGQRKNKANRSQSW